MVLCAKNADQSKVEFVDPPADAAVGDRVYVEGLEGPLWAPTRIDKKKVFRIVQKKLTTDAEGAALYDGRPIVTAKGPIVAPTITGGTIS